MEEKKIKIIINNDTIEITSNNPDLKSLINKIIEQEDEYNFNLIKVECNDENFDKDGFREIIIKSINEFKQNLILNKKEVQKNIDIVEKNEKDISKLENK